MALPTHHAQLSFSTSIHTRIIRTKSPVSLSMFGRIDKGFLLKRCFYFSVGNLPIVSSSRKPFIVSFFKGNTNNGESEVGSYDCRSSSSSSSVQISYLKQQNEESMTGSLDKQWIFSKWSSTPTEKVETVVDERSSEQENYTIKHGQLPDANLLSPTWKAFLGLDLAIKLPVAIFVPWFLAFNVIYGKEIVKELTPLWTLGPLIIFLYVKLARGLCSLYLFTFKQATMLAREAPGFSRGTYNYVKEGKLQSRLRLIFWQAKNQNYRALLRSKLKELEVRMVEKYLDYVESIWPYYCRTIRFLKMLNLSSGKLLLQFYLIQQYDPINFDAK